MPAVPGTSVMPTVTGTSGWARAAKPRTPFFVAGDDSGAWHQWRVFHVLLQILLILVVVALYLRAQQIAEEMKGTASGNSIRSHDICPASHIYSG